MKCIVEFDDLHWNDEVDCLSIAEDLCDQYPNLILNFFVPAKYKGQELFSSPNRTWVRRLRDLVDDGRICLGVHGLLHSPLEFKDKSYEDTVSCIASADGIFAVCGLNYKKVFRGPHWGIGAASVEALRDLGYTHLYSHNDYDYITNRFKDEIKIVKYNFNLKDTWPNMENTMTSDICVAHGHTSVHGHLNCQNGIWAIYPKIEKMVEDGFEFLRIDQYV